MLTGTHTRRIETQTLDDEAGQVVVGPRADGHELDRIDAVEQTHPGVGFGRAGGVEQQTQWLGERDVIVVTPGDLTDSDDDRQ